MTSSVPRVLKILRSTMPLQARRLDLSLLRAGFVLSTLLWLIIWIENTTQVQSLQLGRTLTYWFYPTSLLLLGYLAGRLNRETVGDASSGYLSLIYLTGTRRWEWTLTRIAQIWIGFLSVWVVRIPFLYLIFTLGGIRFHELIVLEVTLLFVFAAAASRSMVYSHNSDNRRSADWAGLGAIFFIEITLLSGRLMIVLLSLLNIKIPISVMRVTELFAEFSIYSRLFDYFFMGPVSAETLGTILIYFGLSLFWLWRYQHQLYHSIGDSPEPALAGMKEKKKPTQRRSQTERCWDDALAWEVYVYYAGGHNNTTGRLILYGTAFLLVTFCVSSGIFYSLMGLTLVVSGATLFNVMNYPAHSFDKEVKARTLSSLVLTPHSGLDIYRGWRRGTLWLAAPDFIYAGLVAVVLYFLHPGATVTVICIALAIYVSGPLLMLSGLVPISLKGLGTALTVILGLTAVVVSGSIAAVFISPYAFPFVAIPVYWGFNQLLLYKFVEHWMQIKIEAEL